MATPQFASGRAAAEAACAKARQDPRPLWRILPYNRTMQRSRAIWLTVGAIFLTSALFMACTVGRAGVERGVLPPLELSVDLGVLRLLTLETDNANCWRPIRVGALCSTGSVLAANRYYTGWLEVRRSRVPRKNSLYYKLFVIRLPNT